jgi:flagellar basal-body rod modification protein FlgD
MAAMAGLLNQSLTAGQALTGTGANPMAAAPAAAGANASSASAGSTSATISANDFLTLLVTEMQNQDPTAQTDPNEYISQLVQVNSLEQLISINQNLSMVLGLSSSSSSGGSSAGQAVLGQANAVPGAASAPSSSGGGPAGQITPGPAVAHRSGAMEALPSAGSNAAAAIAQFAQSVGAKQAPGNLSIPEAHAAAHKVAHALDGQSHTPANRGKLSGAQ